MITTINEFKNIFNINEGIISQDDIKLKYNLQSAILSIFNIDDVTKTRDVKHYDYSNGYVIHICEYIIDTFDVFDNKIAAILKGCNFKTLITKINFQYYEVISKAEPKQPSGYIGISGEDYINNSSTLYFSDINIKKQIKTWVDKNKSLNDDLIKRLLWFWNKSTYNDKTINTRDQGIGSAASTHITKSFESSYIIKDLDIALNMSKPDLENLIKKHGAFKRDKLMFDWKNGIMGVNGKYTEVWD